MVAKNLKLKSARAAMDMRFKRQEDKKQEARCLEVVRWRRT